MANKQIVIKGCRVHNLKNVDVNIPRNQLVVITGLSGSGKSSLAFDTIYAEGQRRYVESLSSYARQFLDIMDKPDVDQIDGLSPVIAIDQKSTINNPRSTIGTITEIYDLLRLLFAKIGNPHCPQCGRPISKQSTKQIMDSILKKFTDKKISVLSPVIKNQKGNHKKILDNIRKADFFQVRLDGIIYNIEEIANLKIDTSQKHNIDIVIDSFTLEDSLKMQARLKEVVEKALDLSNGSVIIQNGQEGEDLSFNEFLYCPICDLTLQNIELKSFSFNNPYGACPKCSGLGSNLEIDQTLLIPNPNLTIAQGALRVFTKIFANQPWINELLDNFTQDHGFSINTEAKSLTKENLETLFWGQGTKNYNIANKKIEFTGVIPLLEKKYKETDSDYVRREIEKYMRVLVCPTCHGKRLKPEVLAVTVADKNISDLTMFSINSLEEFIRLTFLAKKTKKQLPLKDNLTPAQLKIATPIINEMGKRLNNLKNVGLAYLTLDRAASTLSGGEAQRIRLASQMSSNLAEIIYVLDEPTIGLHPCDNEKLIKTLKQLRDKENTIIVVEHDREVIATADYVIDVGPGAGEFGGKIMACGTPKQIAKDPKSLTGKYLSEKLSIKPPKNYREGSKKFLEIIGAQAFNLKNVSVKIPLGKFVCVTGVSGSGKSTLILDILGRYLNQKFYRSKDVPANHQEIKGIEHIDKVISIDQSPIGRTPRSNPATYTGLFTHIRDLFTQLPESKIKGFDAGKFSFNVKGGRCEACAGDGLVKIEMQFLPDVYVECNECKGKRYIQEVLEIYYKGKNISDVLNFTVKEALSFFSDVPAIREKLTTLNDVGLSYLHLGQSATTLSGGEAQRVKLATELSRRATGKTLYILDEPTTGLHFEDIKRLLDILNKLVDKGNTVLIIEHNLDVIKSVDWIIDLGPGGGDDGGKIVGQGTPKEVAKIAESQTGKYLKKIL